GVLSTDRRLDPVGTARAARMLRESGGRELLSSAASSHRAERPGAAAERARIAQDAAGPRRTRAANLRPPVRPPLAWHFAGPDLAVWRGRHDVFPVAAGHPRSRR